jgi:transposase, IS5 family
MKYRQPGLFDIEERSAQLTKMGDPLEGLKARINWEAFRPELKRVYEKDRKSNAGAKPFDVVLMFKILAPQQLNNLSDDGIEYQIQDRFSFMRFLSLELEDRVPDSKTVWAFRDALKRLRMVDVLFAGSMNNWRNKATLPGLDIWLMPPLLKPLNNTIPVMRMP